MVFTSKTVIPTEYGRTEEKNNCDHIKQVWNKLIFTKTPVSTISFIFYLQYEIFTSKQHKSLALKFSCKYRLICLISLEKFDGVNSDH